MYSYFDRDYLDHRSVTCNSAATRGCSDAALLDPLAATELVSPLSTLLQRPVDAISKWSVHPLSGGRSSSLVYRVQGQIETPLGMKGWSLILKTFSLRYLGKPRGHALDPLKEISFYRSGLIDAQSPVRAPRLLDATTAGTARLWLEDVAQEDQAWRAEDWHLAAHQIGKLNGLLIDDKRWSDEPRLNTDLYRQLVAGLASTLFGLIASGNAAVMRLFSEQLVRQILQLCRLLTSLIGLMSALPQTFCHGDAHVGNLFICKPAAPSTPIWAVDWAMAGSAALGSDLAPLIVGAPGTWRFDDPEAYNWLEAVVFDGYIAGLSHAGWVGDPRAVWRGFALAAIVRFCVTVKATAADRCIQLNHSASAADKARVAFPIATR